MAAGVDSLKGRHGASSWAPGGSSTIRGRGNAVGVAATSGPSPDRPRPRAPGQHVRWESGAAAANAIAEGTHQDAAGDMPDAPYGNLYAALQREQQARQVRTPVLSVRRTARPQLFPPAVRSFWPSNLIKSFTPDRMQPHTCRCCCVPVCIGCSSRTPDRCPLPFFLFAARHALSTSLPQFLAFQSDGIDHARLHAITHLQMLLCSCVYMRLLENAHRSRP